MVTVSQRTVLWRACRICAEKQVCDRSRSIKMLPGAERLPNGVKMFHWGGEKVVKCVK